MPGTVEQFNATVDDAQDLVGEIRSHPLLRRYSNRPSTTRQTSPSGIRAGRWQIMLRRGCTFIERADSSLPTFLTLVGILASFVVVTCFVGCHSSGSSKATIDPQLADYYEEASEAYAEGYLDEALQEYRKVIQRAWAMDDPVEAGNAAYNIAAVMTSMSRIPEAKDWLVDARVELYRAGKSAGNTWLLEASIAQNQGRFDEAARLIQRAACSDPPCDADDHECLCGPHDPCEESCIAKIPCVGEKYVEHKQQADCEATFQVQIYLARAKWFAEQYEIAKAKSNFRAACELAQEICDYNLQADLQRTAAMIHLACGDYLQAGWHLDMEAKNLRLAGTYREIPATLELAAAAYEQAERKALTADRLCRVARIWYGRGNINRAWSYVKEAIPFAEASYSQTTKIRLALLVHELRQTIEEQQGDRAPDPRADRERERERDRERARERDADDGDETSDEADPSDGEKLESPRPDRDRAEKPPLDPSDDDSPEKIRPEPTRPEPTPPETRDRDAPPTDVVESPEDRRERQEQLDIDRERQRDLERALERARTLRRLQERQDDEAIEDDRLLPRLIEPENRLPSPRPDSTKQVSPISEAPLLMLEGPITKTIPYRDRSTTIRSK
ncbi:MAG: tetratricopeptide repeat protein [Pirellulaceae bacterium]